jgi:hypothetical protein
MGGHSEFDDEMRRPNRQLRPDVARILDLAICYTDGPTRGICLKFTTFLRASAVLPWLYAGLTAAAVAQDKASRSALIIGVSTYSVPEIPTLKGVPFDITRAKEIARAMGIPEQSTTVLRDTQATKQGVLDALEQLAASTAEGGRVFIYFSGHGTRWFEQAISGCKEGLLTFDYKMITNDEIAQSTRRISAVADKLVVLFDACHSDGVSSRSRTRSIANGVFTPKFFLKGGENAEACSKPSNLKTRGLLAASTRLGALSENFVQITSSRADEVSFDSATGGLATQAVHSCMFGRAVDLDGSGAVSMSEIEQCAQQIVEDQLKGTPDIKPQHVTITGNRNIVPVLRPPIAIAAAPVIAAPPAATPATLPKPPTLAAVAAIPGSVTRPAATALAQPSQALPAAPQFTVPPTVVAAPPPTLAAVPAIPGSVTRPSAAALAQPLQALPAAPQFTVPPVAVAAPPPVLAALPSLPGSLAPLAASPLLQPQRLPAAPQFSVPPYVQPALASLATLNEILAQRNPRRVVDVGLSRTSLKIGADPLALTVRSNHDGYVHLLLLGSDRKSFYLLFPNGLDQDNFIKAKQTLNLPRPDWQLIAQGPAGVDQLLVLVSDTPRDLKALTASLPDSAAPFTFSLNDLPGRAALIDFFAGQGVTGASSSFGAKLLTVKEFQ